MQKDDVFYTTYNTICYHVMLRDNKLYAEESVQDERAKFLEEDEIPEPVRKAALDYFQAQGRDIHGRRILEFKKFIDDLQIQLIEAQKQYENLLKMCKHDWEKPEPKIKKGFNIGYDSNSSVGTVPDRTIYTRKCKICGKVQETDKFEPVFERE